MTLSAKDEPEWMQILRADIAASGSVSATAARVGIARSSLSAIVNQTASSPYATGKASTAKVAERVMNTIGLVACPFLSEYHGSEHRITGLQCREFAYRENPPTSAPREMQHWRACQSCEKRVKQPALPKKHVARDGGSTQQAGIVDKVTLPLPEVGKPQVVRTASQSHAASKPEVCDSRFQQAGVIDNVTLPLPEVGGPQIASRALSTVATNI